MDLLLHITYSGAGGMTEAALTILEAARKEESARHFLLFYGTEDLPEKIAKRCQDLGVASTVIRKAPGNDCRSLLQIRSLLRTLQPAVIFSHMTQPLPALFWHKFGAPRCRVISIEHHSNVLKSRKDWLLTLANHALTDHTIYLTPQYRDEVQQRLGVFFRPSKASVIPIGIDTERFRPAPSPRNSAPFLAGMAARMVSGKDFATLLQAFQIVMHRNPDPAIRLQLAGDGPQRDSLIALSQDLGIRDAVDFLGNLPQESLISTMQSWQIFILSTLGETLSRSIMEAQALGLPIISTHVPGVSAAIENGKTGLLVPPGDPSALALALLQLLHSPALRAALGQNAREKAVSDCSAADTWRRYLKISRSLRSH